MWDVLTQRWLERSVQRARRLAHRARASKDDEAAFQRVRLVLQIHCVREDRSHALGTELTANGIVIPPNDDSTFYAMLLADPRVQPMQLCQRSRFSASVLKEQVAAHHKEIGGWEGWKISMEAVRVANDDAANNIDGSGS